MDDQGKEARPVRRIRTVPSDPGYGPPDPRGNRPNPPQRDLFPYVLGSLISSGVLGLVIIAWLVLSPGRGIVPAVSPTRTPFTGAPVEFPTANIPLGVITGVPGEVQTPDIAIPPAVPTGSPPPADDPPRMQLGDFKALYDDPATRPIILDTRNETAFAEGHIPGAVLFPSTEVASKLATLPTSIPKDRLIVAYCQ